MTLRRHDLQPGSRSPRAFFVPVAWIVALLASYWLLVDWHSVPALVSATFAAMQ